MARDQKVHRVYVDELCSAALPVEAERMQTTAAQTTASGAMRRSSTDTLVEPVAFRSGFTPQAMQIGELPGAPSRSSSACGAVCARCVTVRAQLAVAVREAALAAAAARFQERAAAAAAAHAAALAAAEAKRVELEAALKVRRSKPWAATQLPRGDVRAALEFGGALFQAGGASYREGLQQS